MICLYINVYILDLDFNLLQRSTIDVTLGAHVANTDRAYSAGSYVNYMMTHGDVETLMALAQVNRIARTLDMQV